MTVVSSVPVMRIVVTILVERRRMEVGIVVRIELVTVDCRLDHSVRGHRRELIISAIICGNIVMVVDVNITVRVAVIIIMLHSVGDSVVVISM